MDTEMPLPEWAHTLEQRDQGFVDAYMAMRSKKGLPLSLPTTTGVAQLMTGGKLHRKP